MNLRKMLWRKFKKCKSNKNWELYRKQRNAVTHMRKTNKNDFLKSNCSSIKNGKEFWNIVKPMISSKLKGNSNDIVLLDQNTVVNDKGKACDILNEYFKTIADDFGTNDLLLDNDSVTDVISKCSVISIYIR